MKKKESDLGMNNLTTMKIGKASNDVFEAFVDPSKIGNFWFSSSSERWEAGKIISLTYDEYKARVDISIMEMEINRKIMFQWGANGHGHIVTITLKESGNFNTIVEVYEEGFQEEDAEFIHQLIDNKEGWVFMLTCLKAYLEFGVNTLRGGLVK